MRIEITRTISHFRRIKRRRRRLRRRRRQLRRPSPSQRQRKRNHQPLQVHRRNLVPLGRVAAVVARLSAAAPASSPCSLRNRWQSSRRCDTILSTEFSLCNFMNNRRQHKISRGCLSGRSVLFAGDNTYMPYMIKLKNAGSCCCYSQAFQLMDADKDGIIGKNDLRAAFDSVGRLATDKEIDEMLNEAPAPINFTQLLNLFAVRMSGSGRIRQE